MFFWIIKILAYIPFWILFPTIIKNKKNLPSGKCVLVSNHRSNIDPLLLVNMIWREQHCLAKKELFKNWLLKAFLKGMKAIPVDRKNVEISTVKTCLKVLKNNKILTIFPEGTRNKTNNPLGEIKSGACVFATKSNAPIVPIWIKKKPKLFCFNTIIVGKPFYVEKEQLNQGDEIIKNNLLELMNKSNLKK
mgnify:FL=1